jgi:tryptophanyl-tRNA synthetase
MFVSLLSLPAPFQAGTLTPHPDLSYFEDDDAKLLEIETSYRKGTLLTGELKKMAITMLQEYVKEFQERRKEVTDEVLRGYTTPRELVWKGNPNPIKKEKVKGGKGGGKEVKGEKEKKPKDTKESVKEEKASEVKT